ncbi:MAG: hypothetical protein IJ715_00675 [Bacilli bacterium]|nr:hypothetical protein [Bacilli bacterium]
MNKLPKVYANNIDKKLNNNSYFYASDDGKNNVILNKPDVVKKINEIFSSPNYIYRANVVIKLNDGEIEKKIIGKNKDYLITIDNELISIDSIKDINLK